MCVQGWAYVSPTQGYIRTQTVNLGVVLEPVFEPVLLK